MGADFSKLIAFPSALLCGYATGGMVYQYHPSSVKKEIVQLVSILVGILVAILVFQVMNNYKFVSKGIIVDL